MDSAVQQMPTSNQVHICTVVLSMLNTVLVQQAVVVNPSWQVSVDPTCYADSEVQQ